MNNQEFITDIQNNYRTKYNDTQKRYIEAWLNKYQDILSLLIVETMKSFDPTNTKPIPGIFDFEQALKNVKYERLRPELQNYQQPQLEEPEADEETVAAAFDKLKEVTGKRKLDPVNEQDRRLELKAQAEYLEGME